MRKSRRRLDSGSAVTVDMSSLVDMSFLLLVYFLVTTTLLAKEQDLPMEVPAPGGVGLDLRPIALRVEADNRVLLHPGQSFEEEVASREEGHQLSSLKERLAVLKATRSGVLLEVADGASYQRFMDVLSCLRGEGWDEVGITFHE